MTAERTRRWKADERTGEGEMGDRQQPGHRRRRGRKVLAVAGATTLAAAGATTLAALAAGGVASANAAGATQGGPATVTASTTPHHSGAGHPLLRHLLRRTVHGQFVVRTKGGTLQTFDLDRGVLQSVTSTTITLAPTQTANASVSATITSQTHFRGLPQSQLQPGDRVVLVYEGGNAVLVGARPPKATTSSGS